MRLIFPTLLVRYLAPRAILCASMLFCLIALVMSWAVNARESPSNPFSLYASLLPGQPVTHAIASTFLCEQEDVEGRVLDEAAARYVCSLSPDGGPFDHITLTIFDDTIHQVFFFVRDDALTAGDLAMLWGRPHVAESYRQWISLDWPARLVSATARSTHGSQFGYMLLLERIVFSEKSTALF